MSQVKAEIRREKAKLQEIAFKIFAVVGFLSSIVTLFSWINTTQASLSAQITPTTIEMPIDLEFSNNSQSSFDLSSAIQDLEARYCNPVEVDYRGDKEKNYFYSVAKCADGKDIFSKIQKIVSLNGKKLLAWDISLTNDGKDVAENIILRSPVAADVLATDSDGNPVPVKPTSNNRAFSLPNLNPKDSLKIRITSSTPVPSDYDEPIEKPKVTFSGGVASSKEFVRVSGRYSGIVDFLDGMPTVLQIIVILMGSLFITLIWLLPIGLISDAAEKRKKAALLEETAES